MSCVSLADRRKRQTLRGYQARDAVVRIGEGTYKTHKRIDAGGWMQTGEVGWAVAQTSSERAGPQAGLIGPHRGIMSC